MVTALGSVGTALNIAVGAARVIQAAGDLNEAARDQKLSSLQKAHRVATDILVIGAHGFHAVEPSQGWSPDAKLTLHGVLGAADAAQQISLMSCKEVLKLDDWLDLGSTVMFRVSSFLEQVIELKPVQLGAHLPGVKYAAQILFLLYSGTRFSATVALPFIRYMREVPHPIEMTLIIGQNRDPELRMDPRWLRDWNFILEAPNIDALQSIPEILSMDPVLSQFKCPLSDDQPIRFVRVARGTENTVHPIYYERDAIHRWFEEHPQEKPERWPDEIPFQRENIIESPPIQGQIDQRLGRLLADLQQGREDRAAAMNPIVPLAQALGLHERERDEATIVDALFQRAAGNIEKRIGSILINTLMHPFREGEPARLARKITVTSLVFMRSAKFTEQQSLQAFQALLGSQSEENRRILDQVLPAHRRLETLISLDLQCVELKWD